MELFAPDLPEDFDSFWAEAAAEVRSEPFDFRRSFSNDFDYPGFRVETIDFRGMGGATLHGWIAYPENAKRLPGFVWIPPYGRESLLPNSYGTRDGMVSLSLNFFGHEAFYEETYRMERGYMALGVESPESYVFRQMIQNAMIAARVLQSLPEADEERIGAAGMSQGGGLAIWLGALSPVIRAVCADMPFYCAIRQALGRQAYRYPLKELTDFADTIPLGTERVYNTLSYFDTMHFATRCKVPTQVSYGTKDPSCRPDQVTSCYEALPGEKRLLVYETGHDWIEDMAPNNLEWFQKTMP